jgi:hypothetical protein
MMKVSLRNLRFVCCSLLLGIGVASAASATVINFDGFPAGTVLTNQIPGLTFSSSAGHEVRVIVFNAPPASYPNSICSAVAGGALTCTDPIYIDFASPASGLKFYSEGDDSPGTQAKVTVFIGGVAGPVVNIVQDGNNATAELVDLSASSNVTRIEIANITDPRGLAFDDFQGTPLPVELTSFSAE